MAVSVGNTDTYMSVKASGHWADTQRTRGGHAADKRRQKCRHTELPFRRTLQSPNILLDPAVCLVVILEFFLVAFERRRMDVAAAVDDADGMDDMEHLVKNDVVDDVSWDIDRIERTADRDVVERAVVVAEDAKRLSCGPCQCRFWDLIAEIIAIQRIEYRIEIIDRAFRCCNNLTTSLGFVRSGFFANKIRFDVGVINLACAGRNFLAKQFADKNIRQALVTRQRHFAADVTDADIDDSVAYAYRMIYADIRIK